jgi:putative membrane protein
VRVAPADRLPLALLLSGAVALLVSGWAPADRFNWWMETFPATLGGIVLLLTYRRMRLADVTYVVVWLFALILMTGGHWTYAKVPLGDWAKEAFGLSRNHFDRLGHFMQGVVPAMLARELLVRTSPLGPGRWLSFLCVAVALAVSASYELFEWGYAVAFGGEQAATFLGSQGDVWDAQHDMFAALLGSAAAVALLGGVQQRQIDAIASGEERPAPRA